MDLDFSFIGEAFKILIPLAIVGALTILGALGYGAYLLFQNIKWV